MKLRLTKFKAQLACALVASSPLVASAQTPPLPAPTQAAPGPAAPEVEATAPAPAPAEAAPTAAEAPADAAQLPAPPPSPAPGEASPPASDPSPPRSQPPPFATDVHAERVPVVKTEGSPRYDYLRIGAGLRVGYVATHGFDLFARNDTLPQLSLDATYAFLTAGSFSVAAGVAYDVGGRSGKTRGFETKLVVHRLSVPIEARLHAGARLYGFLRVAPGAAAFATTFDDPTAPASLEQTAWAFSADASLGASVLLGPSKHFDERHARVWLTPEMGYAFTTNAALRPKVDRSPDDAIGTDAQANFGSLSTSGLFWRVSLGMTF